MDKIKEKLSHHLYPRKDPCQDRGVDWPCDVAEALLSEEEIRIIEQQAKDELEEILNNQRRAYDDP